MTFQPKDVVIVAASPLTATFGKAELEQAAALVIIALQYHGAEQFRPVWPKEIGEALRHHSEDPQSPFYLLCRNPFFRPDFLGLVMKGYMEVVGDDPSLTEAARPRQFTEVGLARLAKWARPAP